MQAQNAKAALLLDPWKDLTEVQTKINQTCFTEQTNMHEGDHDIDKENHIA